MTIRINGSVSSHLRLCDGRWIEIGLVDMNTFLARLLEPLTGLNRRQKQLVAFVSDGFLCVLSVIIAVGLRVGIFSLWSQEIAMLSAVALTIFVPTFLALRVYGVVFRYAGRGTMMTLLLATALYGLIFASIVTVMAIPGAPRTVGLIQPIIFFMLVVTSRLALRYVIVDLMGRMRYSGELRRVLIYGAGSAGKQIAGSIATEPGMSIVGYIDDDAQMRGRRLDGFPVFASEDIERLNERAGVTDIVLAAPSLSREKKRQIIQSLSNYGVHVRTLPPIRDILEDRVSISDIRELEIEDLLGRDPVAPDHQLLDRIIAGRTVLVTGAGGSVGSELCRQIAEIGASRLLLLDVNEYALYVIENQLRNRLSRPAGAADTETIALLGSVQDEALVCEIFERYQPDTVFHAAAYKHVPLVEENPLEGIRNNILGTRVVAVAAAQFSTPNFILISTDKAVRPTNIMGATKRAAELVVQALAVQSRQTNFSMVRFGNVLDSSGSVVPLFRGQIAAGGPITVTHRNVTRYFMTIPEAAQLVIQAGCLAAGGEVFVLDMGEPVKIFELAQTMIRLSGLAVKDADNPNGDIEIREIGLRKGEKLIEELLIGNDPIPTEHPKIMMAREAFIPWNQLFPVLASLSNERDPAAALALVKSLVPEFNHADAHDGASEQGDQPTKRPIAAA